MVSLGTQWPETAQGLILPLGRLQVGGCEAVWIWDTREKQAAASPLVPLCSWAPVGGRVLAAAVPEKGWLQPAATQGGLPGGGGVGSSPNPTQKEQSGETKAAMPRGG